MGPLGCRSCGEPGQLASTPGLNFSFISITAFVLHQPGDPGVSTSLFREDSSPLEPQERAFHRFPYASAPRASTKLIQLFLKQFYFILQTLKFVFKFTYDKIYSFWYMILWVSINAEHHVTITQINVQKEHHPPKFSHIILFQSPWCVILLMKKKGQAEVI